MEILMNNYFETSEANPENNLVAKKRLKELFDGLMMENLFELQERSTISQVLSIPVPVAHFSLQGDEQFCSYMLQDNAYLISRVTTAVDVQGCRLSRGPLMLLASEHNITTEINEALEMMKCLVQYAKKDVLPDLSGLDDFMQNLALAQAQSTWSAEYTNIILTNCQQRKVNLHQWEQLSALRDRPFHPLAKSKKGWNAENFRQYSAETSEGFGLTWVAVSNNYLVGNTRLKGTSIAEQLLTDAEQIILRDLCQNHSVDWHQYTLIPVHPWHFKVHVQQELKQAIARSQIVLVAESLGWFYPTASGRSLVPKQPTLVHVKLPLALLCLGALRILPSRYLFNGYQAQQMLTAVITRMPEKERITLCDESQWLAFLPEGETHLSDRSGFLSCLLRRYPKISEKPLIPMAALAVEVNGKVPAIEWLYQQRDRDQSISDFSLDVFTAITQLLCEFSFHCFSHGVMPEVHGQNILVTFNSSSVEQLTLRDHDTLRIFSPWLQQQQIPLFDYQMDWATPNSLICLSPQQLLSYFLTLGIQVNLRSIADAFSQAYDIPMASFWEILKCTVETLLNEMNIPVMAKAILRKELLDSPIWPARHILRPCLVKRTRMMGMPSGVGSVINPFHRLEERKK
jgi:siderophore synthetase component